jgi:WD40 repeat protein
MPPLLGHNLEVNALAISGDGRFLASGNKDGEVLLWDTQIPPPNRGVQILPSRIRKVTPLAVSRMVLCESEDHRWSLMDLLTLGEEPLPPSELAPNGSQPRFTPKRYRRSEPRLDRASLGLHGQLCDPAISPDGKLLVVGSQSGQIGFFDATSLPKIKTIKIDRSNLGSIFAVAFSPDGRRLVLSSGGPQGIELWDVAISTWASGIHGRWEYAPGQCGANST